MKPEQTENLYVETLLRRSAESGVIENSKDFNVEKLTGDASTRRYYRVNADNISYVVCLDYPQDKSENTFTEVQKILKENSCRVPEVYEKRLKKGYILEEDLGDETFLKLISRTKSYEQELEIYRQAVDLLIKIHRVPIEKYPSAVFNSYCFDQKKYLEEIELTNKSFLEGYLGSKVTPEDYIVINENFSKITHQISRYKMLLTHRDYHSRNLMFKDNVLVAIDFQDARRGVPQYDLVSLIEDCYYKISDENKKFLKDYYWNSFLKDSQAGQSYEEFLNVYDLVAIQRIYKAIGSFSNIYITRTDARYLKYIGGAFENLKEILLRNKYDELSLVLAKYYYDS